MGDRGAAAAAAGKNACSSSLWADYSSGQCVAGWLAGLVGMWVVVRACLWVESTPPPPLFEQSIALENVCVWVCVRVRVSVPVFFWGTAFGLHLMSCDVHMCVSICVYVYVYVCVCECCTYLYVRAYMYVYIYKYMYIHTYTRIHTHTYIHIVSTRNVDVEHSSVII